MQRHSSTDSFWLKSTLLWFGQVRRIVPYPSSLNDDPPEVKSFAETLHPSGIGTLLDTARIWEQPVSEAKDKLLKQLQANLPALVEKYSESKTPTELHTSFKVHRYKLLDNLQGNELPDFLLQNHLAWLVTTAPDRNNLLAIHPKLASGIVSTLALAIARNEGLGIVTDDPSVHNTLIAERESDVLDALLELPRSASGLGDEGLAEDLAQLVFSTQFDLSSLTANDIRTLIEEKKDLARFRMRVTELVSDIPASLGHTERLRRLEMKKKDILHERDEYRAHFPNSARKLWLLSN